MLNFNSHPNICIEQHIKNITQKDDTPLAVTTKYFHDLAKASIEFQKKLNGEDNNNLSHAAESAVLFFVMNHDKLPAKDVISATLAIQCHHISLKNACNILGNKQDGDTTFRAIDNLYREKTFESLPLEYAKAFDSLKNTNQSLNEYLQSQLRKLFRENKSFSLEDVIEQRSLFANLIFNDKYDAICGERFEQIESVNFNNIFKNHIKSKYLSNNINIRDDFRNTVLEKYSKNSNERIFVISAPTGISKTLTSLALAENIGKKIIFAPPVTAIIDQVHDDVIKIYDKTIKVHHKTFIDFDEQENDKERYNQEKFLSETLNANIVVTTQWQIMSALFSDKNSDCAKMYSLKNSTIIIDEIQALPHQIINIIERYFIVLSQKYNITVILMSATMPRFASKFCQLSEERFFESYNRYKLEWLEGTKICNKSDTAGIEHNKNTLISSIIKNTKQNNKILVVLNQIATAQEIFTLLKNDKRLTSYKILSLTTYMLGKHRKEVINTIKNAAKNDKIILVSTQSIEAGVDLDFDAGFREIAPVSSIVQTAGRVNRHGLNMYEQIRTLYVFGTVSEYTSRIYGDMFIVSRRFLEHLMQEKSVFEKDILALINEYFQKLPFKNPQVIESAINQAEHKKIYEEIFYEYFEKDDHKISLFIETDKNRRYGVELMELLEQRAQVDKNADKQLFFDINGRIDAFFKANISPNIIKVSKQDINTTSTFSSRYRSKIPMSSYEHIFVTDIYDDELGVVKTSVMDRFPNQTTDTSFS
jgi:CRISPR-associated endonuclease/helicase Cas3